MSGDVLWERLGAGTHTGLAWRASGEDASGGPRALEVSPADAHDPCVPGSDLGAGLLSSALVSAVEMGIGAITAPLGRDTIRDVQRVGPALDAVWAQELGLTSASRLLDDVLAAGESRAPVGVEAAFGAALARGLEQGMRTDGVDVSLLRDAAGPLEDLLAALPVWGDGLAARLVLDDDVMRLARIAWRLLHVTHQSWFGAHNRAVVGDAHRVRHNPVDTWAGRISGNAAAVVGRVHVLRCLDGAEEELGDLIGRHFTWAAGSDRQGFATWLDGRILTPVERVLGVAEPVAGELALRLEPHLPHLHLEEDVLEAIDAVGEYLQTWLLTDAGLLARLHRELHLASDTWAWRRLSLRPDGAEWSGADLDTATRDLARALADADLLPDP